MKSMKMTGDQGKEMAPVAAGAAEAPKDRYPYGLRLTLDKDTLAKLGIEMPEVGEEVGIQAVAKVVSCHESEGEGGDYASCELQITDMQVDEESSPSEVAGRLYGGGDKE